MTMKNVLIAIVYAMDAIGYTARITNKVVRTTLYIIYECRYLIVYGIILRLGLALNAT